MNWEAWLVPIIALAVLILGSIFRAGEQRTGNAQPGSDDETGGRPRRTPTEIDEFLREARRRRQAAEADAKSREEPPPPPPPPPKPVPRAQTRQRARPSRPAERPSRRPEPLQEEVIPVVLPVTPEPVLTSRTVEPLPSRSKKPTGAELIALAGLHGEQERKPPLALKTLTGWVASRENLRMAMILREILDPPLCRRSRRIGE